ncbi:hypothetical protein H0H92_013515, partial [Tricholoma furcatifolium]
MALRFKALKAPVNDVFRSNTELFRPLKKFELTASDWDRLDALITILQFPHDVQHVMAKEKVPVLAGTIPSFEIMMSRWERLASRHADLKPIIDVGLDYATKYYKKMDDTEAYVVAMFLHPGIRFQRIDKYWDSMYREQARAMVKRI